MIDAPLLEALLDYWPVARFASIQSATDADQQAAPHQVPIVFCRVDNALYSPLDGKTKDGRELKRFRNIRENPNVSLLLDQYSTDWRELWWVRLDGTATRHHATAAEAAQLADALRAKYPQYASVPLHRDRAEPIYMRVCWQRVQAWGQTDAEANIRAALQMRLGAD